MNDAVFNKGSKLHDVDVLCHQIGQAIDDTSDQAGVIVQPELAGVDLGIARDLREVTADQREVVVPVGLTDAADALQSLFVPDMATERVAGIGRVGDHPARPQELDRLPDEAQLRIERMQFEAKHGAV